MMRWLLNHLPTGVLGVVIVGGVVAAAMLAFRWSRRHGFSLGDQSEALEPFLGVVGAIYGIVLAFVIVDLWTNFDATKATVSKEASALAQIAVDIRTLDQADRTLIDRRIAAYVDALVGDEWHAMRVGRQSRRADKALGELALALEQAHPDTTVRQVWYSEAVTNFNAVIDARRARLEAVRREVPLPFRLLLFGGAVVPIGFMLLLGVDSRRIHALMVATVAILVSYSLFLAVILEHPFSGSVSVGTESFRSGVLAALTR
jgi:hypothetical protein